MNNSTKNTIKLFAVLMLFAGMIVWMGYVAQMKP